MAQMLGLVVLSLLHLGSGVVNVCDRPVLSENVKVRDLQRFSSPGDEVRLLCEQGYAPVDQVRSRKIICTSSGEWTTTKFKCTRKVCRSPSPILNGNLVFDDNKHQYQSTVKYTCDNGYTMEGNSSLECLVSGQWSGSPPTCKPMTCGVPPIPLFARLTYNRKSWGKMTEFGSVVTYECRPPLALLGEERASCTAEGVWSKQPVCTLVRCASPPDILNGFKSVNVDTTFYYKDKVKYGCNKNYKRDGPLEIECEKTGEWSYMPTCKPS